MAFPVSDQALTSAVNKIRESLDSLVIVETRIAVALEKLLADEEAPVPAGVDLTVTPQP